MQFFIKSLKYMRSLFSIGVLLIWTLGAVAQSVTIRPSGITPAIGGTYPRLAYDALVALPNPQRGDMAYDLTFNCLRIYNGNKWVCTFQSPTDLTPNMAAIARGGGTDWDNGYDVAVDGSGNFYVTGSFEGTATFGTISLTSVGFGDIFVAKYNSSGTLQWVQKAGGSGGDFGYEIAVDGGDNVYITGYFGGSATFGTTHLTSGEYDNIFVAKYSSSGTLQWVQKAGGASGDGASGIAADGSGNVYVTGNFLRTAAFGTTNLTSTGGTDIFVAKYNSSGTLQWVQKAGGVNNEVGQGVAIDGSGNVYVTGYFQGVATFGTTSLTAAGSVGNNDIFVAKYNGSGTLQWVQKAGGTSPDVSQSIAVDGGGNVYITGFLQGTATFGTTSVTSAGSGDIFVAKYNGSGTFQWVQKAGGPEMDRGHSVAVDGSGNVYLRGSFQGTAIFGSTTLTSAGVGDMFVAKYNGSGVLQWIQKAGWMGDEEESGLAVDSGGSVYVTGNFLGTATFGTTTLTSAVARDIFVARIDR
ncbi:MAG TPA: hypothetical protein DCM71_16015 [Runella sp.]|nr:hypothetical protein [Runella sp.]